MITFTKEQLIASAHARIEFAEMMLAGELEPLKERTWSIELELARIALASLEAEPVADVVAWSSQNEERTCDVRLRRHDINPGPLYTAPPAPVSVPDFDTLRLLFEDSERESDHGFNLHKYGIGYADEATQARWEEWIACRAAMLQGADGNSPVIPDGWVMLPAEPTQAMMNAWLSEVANWRGHAAGYRAMIAAAPQQEVNNDQ